MELHIGKHIGKKHLMGSRYFFGCYPDYTSKDNDYLYFVDEPIMFKEVMNLKSGNGKDDIFLWKRMKPEEYIERLFDTKNKMQAGKFLVKEICDDVGFTIEHLKQIEKCFNNIDEKHSYEKIIYDAYIQNNDFSLTDEQREKAYNVYKKSH